MSGVVAKVKNVEHSQIKDLNQQVMNIESDKDIQTCFVKEVIRACNQGDLQVEPRFVREFMFAFDEAKEVKFPVNAELLVEQGVYSRKDHVKKYLTDNLIEGEDYIILNEECSETEELRKQYITLFDNEMTEKSIEEKKEKDTECKSREHGTYQNSSQKPHLRGSPKEYIYLTTEAYKELCMMAKNPAGKMARNYFILIERFIKTLFHSFINEYKRRLKLSDEKLALKETELVKTIQEKTFKVNQVINSKRSITILKKKLEASEKNTITLQKRIEELETECSLNEGKIPEVKMNKKEQVLASKSICRMNAHIDELESIIEFKNEEINDLKTDLEPTIRELEYLRRENKRLEKSFEKYKLTHGANKSFPDLMKGPCFYLLSLTIDDEPVHKIGITEKDLRSRIGDHRFYLDPDLKIEFICYTTEVKKIEEFVKAAFEDSRIKTSSEIFKGLNTENVINYIQFAIKGLKIKCQIDEENRVKYNEKVELYIDIEREIEAEKEEYKDEDEDE